MNIGKSLVTFGLTGMIAALPVARSAADQNTGIVRGYVRDEKTNQPVCAMRVYAVSATENTWSTVTDNQGFFVFLALFPGVAKVAAAAAGEVPERNVGVSPNHYSELTLYVRSPAAQRSPACRRDASIRTTAD